MTTSVDRQQIPGRSAGSGLRVVGPRLSDPRLHVASVLLTVQVLGQTVLRFDLSIAQILVSILTAGLLEVVITAVRTRVIAWPASAMLTGNGVALIMRVPGTEHGDWWSLRGWWIFAAVAGGGVLTKYLIRVDGRPLFNPSNATLVPAFLLLGSARADPQDLWWGPPSPGLFLTYAVIVVGGLIVTSRLRLLPLAAAFLVTFAASTGVLAAGGHCMTARWHVGPVCGAEYWWNVVGSPEVLIFMLFMITDPRTVPKGRGPRLVFGTAVGVLAGLLVALQTTEFATKVAILASLTVVCAFRPALERLDARRPVTVVPRSPTQFARVGVGGIAVVALLLGGNALALDDPSEGAARVVEVDPTGLPVVVVDDEVLAVTSGLDRTTTARMVHDLAVALETAAVALERGDPGMVDAVGGGRWLDERRDEIAARAEGGRVAVRRYELATATLVLAGRRVTPQALPPLGLEVTGEEITAVDGDTGTTEFEATFVMEPRDDGHFVVVDDDRAGGDLHDDGPPGTMPIDDFARYVRLGRDVDEGSQPDQLPLFDDVTSESGIRVRTGSARVDTVELPGGDVEATSVWTALMTTETYFVTGQAGGDFARDGRPDLYHTDQDGPNHLFRNRGDGTFEPAPRRLADPVRLEQDHSGGATWVDFDNDGWRDLHVLSDAGSRLFRNEEGERFVDVTDIAGVRGEGKGMTASWADVDGDGWLDVYVANYGCQPCGEFDLSKPLADQAHQDHLFMNDGDGTFTDRTSWISHLGGTRGFAFAAAWLDHDEDGRPDLYVVNDVRYDRGDGDVAAGHVLGDGSTPGNALIRNGGPGCGGWCFSDVSEATGTAVRADAMGVAVDDFDGDGRADVFFTNGGFHAGPAAMLRNEGDGRFRDVAAERNAHLGEWSWGASPLDVDNDARRDIFVSVGYSDALQQLPGDELTDEVIQDAPRARQEALRKGTARAPWGYVHPPWEVAQDPSPRTDQNRVLLQGPDGRFAVRPVGDASGLSRVHYGNAVADYDGDGWVDVVVGNLRDGYSLLRNRAEHGAGNHRSVIELRGDGRRVSRDAVGARVVVTGSDGRRQTGWVQIGGSLGSGSDIRLGFGLGDATIEQVEVHWPDGTTSLHRRPPTDHALVIGYGDDDVASTPLAARRR